MFLSSSLKKNKILRFALYPIIIFRRCYLHFERLFYLYYESSRLKKNNKNLKINIIYDLLVAPPTYGDFLLVLIVARYLSLKRYSLNLIFITGEFRADWSHFTNCKKNLFINELLEISFNFLKYQNINITKMDWISFKKTEYVNSDILFKNLVLKRKSFYNQCFNLSISLASNESKNFLNKFLFNSFDFNKKLLKKNINKNYVILNLRNSLLWEVERNNTDNEFIELCNKIQIENPKCKILLTSDVYGSNYFFNLAKTYNISVLNSKNFVNNFLGDAMLVLNAKNYYQIRGGGMNIFRIFSLSPYSIECKLATEKMWSKTLLTPWQKNNQHFKLIGKKSVIF